MTEKPFTESFIKGLHKRVALDEISFSRMVELLNERAMEFSKEQLLKELDYGKEEPTIKPVKCIYCQDIEFIYIQEPCPKCKPPKI